MDQKKWAVQVSDVTKVYKLYSKPSDRLKEIILRKSRHQSFKALDNISFNIKQNECLGIIGKNGSGKSTLLKIITGVLTPTNGYMEVNGRISALLELGAGFNPELSGMENIFMNATIMGISKHEIESKLEEILSFAEIGDFIHQPVKTYSSGMFVRLAFAVAINVDPEILIVDEALSVGDIRFQQKCFRKIDELKKNKTVIFVSHDMAVINKYCDRVIWINEGKVVDEGTPKEISKKYQAFMIGASYRGHDFSVHSVNKQGTNASDLLDVIAPFSNQLDIMGDETAIITGMAIVDPKTNERTMVVECGETVSILIKLDVLLRIENPIIGVTIKDRLGNVITQTNSYILGEEIGCLEPSSDYVFGFEFDFPYINHGQYTVSPAIASGTQTDHKQHSWVHDASIIEVLPQGYEGLSGIVLLQDVSFKVLTGR
ncbi:ABC transporter ATP-binding protein [Paenibacillus sp. JSM ZJ436]|uniref:ABC transporter ATP-binding protein n=1 Tax=Paenibacillus sp. JSM ZJ436 TaxID=3376190 RepID=UPI0037927CB6